MEDNSCRICHKPAKYKCPACSMKSCSSACVKTHKRLFGCTGYENKSKFVPMQEYDQATMQSDMSFLMNIVQDADQAHRKVTKLSRFDNRKRFSFLLDECKRRNFFIRLLPKAMVKHQRNTSLFNKFEKILYWHSEWKFLTSKNFTISHDIHPLNENHTLNQLLLQALEEFHKLPEFVHELSSSEDSHFVTLWHTHNEKEDGVVQKVYSIIQPGMTLREILERQNTQPNPIVEYPTIYFTTAQVLPTLLINNN